MAILLAPALRCASAPSALWCCAAGQLRVLYRVPLRYLLLACGYASLRVRPLASVARFTGTRLSPSLPSQRGQVLCTLCSSAARLPVPGRCSDFTLSRPAEVLGSSTSKRFSGCLPVGEARAELACLRHSASCTGGSAREGAAR